MKAKILFVLMITLSASAYAGDIMVDRGYCQGLLTFAGINHRELLNNFLKGRIGTLNELNIPYMTSAVKTNKNCSQGATKNTTFDDLKICLIKGGATSAQKLFNEGFYLSVVDYYTHNQDVSVDTAITQCNGIALKMGLDN